MNRQKWSFLIAALLLIGTGGGLLANLRTHQKLGKPGVKTCAIPESIRLQVELPEKVLDYRSEPVEVSDVVMKALPQDTSFGQRRYTAPDGFGVLVNVVLMGSDRTSLHKPQICLRGTGWVIDKTEPATVTLASPQPYELPVMKLSLSPEKPGDFGGAHGVYVYWFVADHAYTREHYLRMWWMFKHLMQSGELQRWSYITCFAGCEPGQEDATFERMKGFIAACAPQFQAASTPERPATLAQ